MEILHGTLSLAEADRVKILARALVELDGAANKAAVMPMIIDRLERSGVRGVSAKSLYRKLAQAKRGGLRALIDGRVARSGLGEAATTGAATAQSALVHNRAFRDYWTTLVCSNKRKTAPAYRQLLERLARGEEIPGVGTWRDIFAREHGGIYPAPDMACPWSPFTLDAPKGWTLRNLMRFVPSEFALTAVRQGTLAAAMTALPSVPFTRVGLAPCQVVEIDDMWYEAKVALPGNRFAQRVAEFAMIDRLTGHVIAYLPKPVRERADGSLEVLRAEWTKYLIAHLLCSVGVPAAGCTIIGEHGTAKTTDADFVDLISKLTDGRVKLTAGGILSTALAKGLPDGSHKGNPRRKGFLEGYHALLKNELGDAPGNIGGGRGKEPEEAYGLTKIDNSLRRLAAALEPTRPGITERLRFPYMPWTDYAALLYAAYTRLENRTWHKMEGWEDCGFVVPEVRAADGTGWANLEAMDERRRLAFRSLVDSGDVEFRVRRMSPREAWESRRAELRTIPAFAAPLIMGEGLARICEVRRDGTMQFRDDTTLRKVQIVAQLDGRPGGAACPQAATAGTVLARGAKYKVWVNPLEASRAYVCDLEGRYLGTAAVMVATNPDETEDLTNLGIRQKAMAARMRELKPYVSSRRRAVAEAARVNLEALGAADPVAEGQARRATAVRMTEDARAVEAVTDDELLPDDAGSGLGEAAATDYDYGEIPVEQSARCADIDPFELI